MSLKNGLTQSLRIKSELEGKPSNKIVTIAIKLEAHEIIRTNSDIHNMSQVEFITSILMSLQVLSQDDIKILLLMGQAKSVESGMLNHLPIQSKFLMNVGRLILIPYTYYRQLVSNQKSDFKEK